MDKWDAAAIIISSSQRLRKAYMSDIYVQVAPSQDSRGDLGGRTLTERLVDRIDEVGSAVLSVSDSLRDRFDSLADDSGSNWGVDGIEISFSIDLEAEAGVVVTRASASAGFEVTLTWSKSDRQVR